MFGVKFSEDSSFITQPYFMLKYFLLFQRHKLSKDWFVPSALKNIEVNGVYGDKVIVWDI